MLISFGSGCYTADSLAIEAAYERSLQATDMVPSFQFLDESLWLSVMPIEPPLCFHVGQRLDDVAYFARINRIPESARYMIVYTDRTAMNRPVPYSSSVTTAAATPDGYMPLKVSSQIEYPRSLEGVVQVWWGADGTLEANLDDECGWH